MYSVWRATRRLPQPWGPRLQLYLGADTTVADGMEILGKPLDNQDAGRMLRQLRGKEHTVYTAVALHANHGAQTLSGSLRDPRPHARLQRR